MSGGQRRRTRRHWRLHGMMMLDSMSVHHHIECVIGGVAPPYSTPLWRRRRVTASMQNGPCTPTPGLSVVHHRPLGPDAGLRADVLLREGCHTAHVAQGQREAAALGGEEEAEASLCTELAIERDVGLSMSMPSRRVYFHPNGGGPGVALELSGVAVARVARPVAAMGTLLSDCNWGRQPRRPAPDSGQRRRRSESRRSRSFVT